MYSFQIISILVLFCIIAISLSNQVRIYKDANTLCAVYISCLLYYCVVPLLTYVYSDDIKSNRFTDRVLDADIWEFINGWLGVFLFIITITISHRLSYYKSKVKSTYLGTGFLYKMMLKKYIVFCSVIGIICFVLYIYSFGGIDEMLLHSENLRSFTSDMDVSYITKILVLPAQLVVVVPCFTAMYIDEKKNNYILKIFFILMFLFGLLFYINNAGKTGIIIYILAIIVPTLNRFLNHSWMIVLLIGILCGGFVVYLDNLFLYLVTGVFYDVDGTSFLDSIAQFSYPSSNIMSLDGISEISGYRFGMDVIAGFLNQMPGVSLPLSYEYTSQYYGGLFWRTTGGTPNDAVTFGYMQFNHLGVIMCGAILGTVSGWTDAVLKRIGNGFGKDFFKTTIILAFFVTTTNADVYTIIRNQFALWLSLIFLYSLNKKTNKINIYG